MKKVCVVTGTRAEYGILRPLIKKINKDNELILQIVATGMHLSPEFGMTYKEIEKDGFVIDEKVEILLSADTPTSICKTMGLAMISFGETLQRLKPDAIVILGDRYEMLAVATVAMILKIPILHLHGGELTEGLIDDAIRHSITKMSYLHFTSTEQYRKRVIQLGEDPKRVFNVGAMGIESIKEFELLTKEELEKSIDFSLGEKFILVTFHPVTLDDESPKEQFKSLLDALDEYEDIKILFTKANSDTYGRIINEMIDNYVVKNKHKAIAFKSLGQLRYYSAMKYCDIVLGNSSSGIIEAPSFKKPTINIGDRQRGRIEAESIINCKPNKKDIVNAINIATSDEFKFKLKDIVNPYGEGNVSDSIVKQIKILFDKSENISLKKVFYDI